MMPKKDYPLLQWLERRRIILMSNGGIKDVRRRRRYHRTAAKVYRVMADMCRNEKPNIYRRWVHQHIKGSISGRVR
jgi:hypothetical protein